MTKIEEKYMDKYFYLFADCIVTKGFSRTLITDTSRKSLYFIDNSYYDTLQLFREMPVGEIILMLEDESDVDLFQSFLNDLINQNLGLFVDNISLLPEVEKVWDHPSTITNGIIDIRDELHDFDKIFIEYDALGCEYIEIRSYSERSAEDIMNIVSRSAGRGLKYMHFLTKFSEEYLAPNVLKEITDRHTFLHLTVFGAPADKISALNNFTKANQIAFLQQDIGSSKCCGRISLDSFRIQSVKGTTENLLYNGCLNRKISIDERGYIKNCPSMERSFGHINEQSLLSVVVNEEFLALWGINKSMINVCSACEFRSVCTDCRAFVNTEGGVYAKPSKCKYDPYSGVWG